LPGAVWEHAERTEQRLGETEQQLAREARRRAELEEELRRLRAQHGESDEQSIDG
jgi:hypothetical protein